MTRLALTIVRRFSPSSSKVLHNKPHSRSAVPLSCWGTTLNTWICSTSGVHITAVSYSRSVKCATPVKNTSTNRMSFFPCTQILKYPSSYQLTVQYATRVALHHVDGPRRDIRREKHTACFLLRFILRNRPKMWQNSNTTVGQTDLHTRRINTY
jgi:hypothetical protein